MCNFLLVLVINHTSWTVSSCVNSDTSFISREPRRSRDFLTFSISALGVRLPTDLRAKWLKRRVFTQGCAVCNKNRFFLYPLISRPLKVQNLTNFRSIWPLTLEVQCRPRNRSSRSIELIVWGRSRLELREGPKVESTDRVYRLTVELSWGNGSRLSRLIRCCIYWIQHWWDGQNIGDLLD